MSSERTELLKILREDEVSVCVYRNQVDDRVYFDIVLTRLSVKRRVWLRGANFKPDDLPKLRRLLEQAEEVVEVLRSGGELDRPDLSQLV